MATQMTTTAAPVSAARLESLRIMANRLRRHSLLSTAKAGSGHPTSCMSCADLISALFFEYLRFNVHDPHDPNNDRFVLSKGHAAPILWAAWAEAGAFPVEHLQTLRQIDSDLEGHPTPRNAWVDVATGSLGQGLSVGIGMALAGRIDNRPMRSWVLMGDGEMAEGSVWEAVELAAHYHLGNLIAIVDVNRLGQSQPTMLGHEMEVYESRFFAFGWHTQVIDGHDMEQILEAYAAAAEDEGRPSVILARTIKGKGASVVADKEGWHGKPLEGADLESALNEIGPDMDLPEELLVKAPELSDKAGPKRSAMPKEIAPPEYDANASVATRVAFGTGLKKLGAVNPTVVALDGDVMNSTYSEYFAKAYPDRFFEGFIAEQNMVGMAVGLGAIGKVPFASSFACFLTRAFDQIRMAGISRVNLKLCGSHCGCSIGEDGPSQMALEDLAMMRSIYGSTVLYPSDAVSAERLVEVAAYTPGVVYIRTTRPKTPILYDNNETFEAGGSKTLRSSREDRATIVAAGITVHEALKAYERLKTGGIQVRVIDLYSVKPLDTRTLIRASRETGFIVTVEDHYPQGGLGEAVLSELAGEDCRFMKLAVDGLPRSGEADKLLGILGIDSDAIVDAIEDFLRP